MQLVKSYQDFPNGELGKLGMQAWRRCEEREHGYVGMGGVGDERNKATNKREGRPDLSYRFKRQSKVPLDASGTEAASKQSSA